MARRCGWYFFERLDWFAISLHLTERAALPAVLLNGQGELVLIAAAAERALGWLPDTIGSDWITRHVAADHAASARRSFEQALAGASRRVEVQVLTRRGEARARFEASAIGSGGDRGLLLVLDQLQPLGPDESFTENDYDYEVRAIAHGRPHLRWIGKPGIAAIDADGACYEVLHRRTQPCESCPLTLLHDGGSTGVAVKAGPPSDYVVTSVYRLNEDAARLSVRRLPMASLAAVVRARLDELSQRARLSQRERAVFGFLMDGRAVDEIASQLAISARTVKFHQANLLQKLGADSRVDLMRLVF